jgi:hypothetical protein
MDRRRAEATALSGHKRGLNGFALLDRVNAAFNLGARFTCLVAGLRERDGRNPPSPISRRRLPTMARKTQDRPSFGVNCK